MNLLKSAFNTLDLFLSTPITYSQGRIGRYLRYAYYQKKLKWLGKHVVIDQGVIIVTPNVVSINDHSWIDKNTIILGGRSVEIGRRVHIAQNCLLQGVGSIKVGDYVGIAANSMIFSGTDTLNSRKRIGPMIPKKYRNPVFKKPVVIEKDVFVGAASIILPGVTIGEGAVIGACSLVNKDIPPWKIAIGVPAKPIKNRPKITLPDF